MILSKQELEQIEARAKAATTPVIGRAPHSLASYGRESTLYSDLPDYGIEGLFTPDAEFFAHAKPDVLALVEEVKLLQALIDDAVKVSDAHLASVQRVNAMLDEMNNVWTKALRGMAGEK